MTRKTRTKYRTGPMSTLAVGDAELQRRLQPHVVARHVPEPECQQQLHGELRARRETQRAALDDLQEVVGESEARREHRDAEHGHARRIAVREDEERDADRGEDDQPAHRRSPGLGVVLLGALLADVLAELLQPQVLDELRAQEDADQHRRHPGDQHLTPSALRPSATSSREGSVSATSSRPAEREPLTSTASPRPSSGASSSAASVGSATSWSGRVVACRLADPDQQLDPGLTRVLADLAVVAGALRAQLGHLAEHRDPPPRDRQRAEVIERSPHRDRVGVVAVVHQHDPVAELEALAAEAREAYRRRPTRHLGRRGADRDDRRRSPPGRW